MASFQMLKALAKPVKIAQPKQGPPEALRRAPRAFSGPAFSALSSCRRAHAHRTL